MDPQPPTLGDQPFLFSEGGPAARAVWQQGWGEGVIRHAGRNCDAVADLSIRSGQVIGGTTLGAAISPPDDGRGTTGWRRPAQKL